MNTYQAYYDTFDKPLVVKDKKGSRPPVILQLQEHIEDAAGYHNLTNTFAEYETARIYEFNSIGRQVAEYYFSMKAKKWMSSKTKVTVYHSWRNVEQPFKGIAQYLLTIFGYKKEQLNALNELVQKNKTKWK